MQDRSSDGQAAATAAREQARDQARDHAQMMRDQAQMMRDAARMQREIGTPIIVRPPFTRGPSPRQEKMLFAGFFIVVMAAVVIFYPLVRAFARRLEGGRRTNPIDAGSAERLQRIEQAVDAMAIEIERISEGQRFTTKLLSARADAHVP
jgi:hypothetical protein